MKDNFSRQSALYAKYRPAYPDELFDFIFRQVPVKNAAWDCATGNGQTAGVLATVFDKVYATDISQKQLDHARLAPNITYSVSAAEQTGFANDTFDLITVSQALHWFRFDAFYNEVRRVAKANAWIAVWMYALLEISPSIDALIHHYHYHTLANYWDEERKYVDELYQTIPFPFAEIHCPQFAITYQWTLEDLEGYLHTWSALQKYRHQHEEDPVVPLMAAIKQHWATERMDVRFPLYLRMGQIVK